MGEHGTMTRHVPPESTPLAFFMAFGLALPVVAFMAWTQALAFDPCASIFARPGRCLTSGLGFAGGGAALIAVGSTLVLSAVPAVRAGRASVRTAAAVGWLGLWLAVIGASMVFAGLSVG